MTSREVAAVLGIPAGRVRFDAPRQVIDLVAGAAVVDPATWNASLPDDVVGPDDRVAAIEGLLAEVPLPPGLDPASLVAGGTNDRDQFIVEVTGAVACGWLDFLWS